MILKRSDLTQRIHKESLLAQIQSDTNNFDLLLTWSLESDQPVGWRSAWLLRQILKVKDSRLSGKIAVMLSRFQTFNESQKREWLKALLNQELTDEEEGVLFDFCMSEWQKISNHPALRASAIQVIFKILTAYPELKDELTHVMTPEYTESLSPGIQKGVLKSWNKISK
ncbi:MAG: hypothetical protein HRT61_18315 [Ekhidna sp.]|nr:hypothetical protein [Ekhidna sp.]